MSDSSFLEASVVTTAPQTNDFLGHTHLPRVGALGRQRPQRTLLGPDPGPEELAGVLLRVFGPVVMSRAGTPSSGTAPGAAEETPCPSGRPDAGMSRSSLTPRPFSALLGSAQVAQAGEAAAGSRHVPSGEAGRNGRACLVGQGPEEGGRKGGGLCRGHPRGQPGGRAGQRLKTSRSPRAASSRAWASGPHSALPQTQPPLCPGRSQVYAGRAPGRPCSQGTSRSIPHPVGEGAGLWGRHQGQDVSPDSEPPVCVTLGQTSKQGFSLLTGSVARGALPPRPAGLSSPTATPPGLPEPDAGSGPARRLQARPEEACTFQPPRGTRPEVPPLSPLRPCGTRGLLRPLGGPQAGALARPERTSLQEEGEGRGCPESEAAPASLQLPEEPWGPPRPSTAPADTHPAQPAPNVLVRGQEVSPGWRRSLRRPPALLSPGPQPSCPRPACTVDPPGPQPPHRGRGLGSQVSEGSLTSTSRRTRPSQPSAALRVPPASAITAGPILGPRQALGYGGRKPGGGVHREGHPGTPSWKVSDVTRVQEGARCPSGPAPHPGTSVPTAQLAFSPAPPQVQGLPEPSVGSGEVSGPPRAVLGTGGAGCCDRSLECLFWTGSGLEMPQCVELAAWASGTEPAQAPPQALPAGLSWASTWDHVASSLSTGPAGLPRAHPDSHHPRAPQTLSRGCLARERGGLPSPGAPAQGLAVRGSKGAAGACPGPAPLPRLPPRTGRGAPPPGRPPFRARQAFSGLTEGRLVSGDSAMPNKAGFSAGVRGGHTSSPGPPAPGMVPKSPGLPLWELQWREESLCRRCLRCSPDSPALPPPDSSASSVFPGASSLPARLSAVSSSPPEGQPPRHLLMLAVGALEAGASRRAAEPVF
ncbi:basic proline-rich protein-like [Hippopotamus amphibius kiboko]|uniref:basic proline-rich protein-like n=1 Tax=Hippopotamus amphibius kiboko TaxID=575201 RepID=UPI0025963FE8|nr:basic proline-rich protein-like [Hippopotamus amphibius kiboko]